MNQAIQVSRIDPKEHRSAFSFESKQRIGRTAAWKTTHHLRRSVRIESHSARVMASNGNPSKVLVTGAGGRTGKLVFKLLKQEPEKYEPYALVRSEKSAKKNLPQAEEHEIVVGNVSNLGGLREAMSGKDALIIVTSAVPKIKYLSLFPVLFKKMMRNPNPGMPEFYFEKEGDPQSVDWIGQKNQIDAAKEAGIKKVVLVSSMGGTQKDNYLNRIGNGNILLWKRKAEEYLVKSGIDYTILHPGGLQDQPGNERELVVGVDDALLETTTRQIPREDVARICIESLTSPVFSCRAFDLASKKKGEGNPTATIEPLIAELPPYDFTINSQLDKEGVSV